MAPIRTPLVTAAIGSVLLVGCQDDVEKLLSEAGVSERELTQTREAAPPASLPALDAPAKIDRKSELPGGIGRYEIVHDPSRAKVEIRFSDLDPATSGLHDATLWLAGPDGPVAVELESCPSIGPHDLAARSDLLAQPPLRGVLRFELDGQRCRIPLGTPGPQTQPVPSGPLDSPAHSEPA